MMILNFLEGRGQVFVFGVIVVILLTSGVGVAESGAGLQGVVLGDREKDALWESVQEKGKIYNKEPEFSQDEYLVYLKKVEEANPDADWKKIIAALHYQEFGVDMGGTLPIVPLPLFIHGNETLGYKDVDLLFKIGRTKNYNAPQFVYDKNCRKIDITHSYAGVRSDLNRGDGIGDLFGLWSWFMRRANTNWGDTWQSVTRGKWDPPEQYAGDYMGLWLSDYYRKPGNQNTPLSSAYKEYFDSQSGERVCDNEEVCKKAGYYWYNNRCNINPEGNASGGNPSGGEFSCPTPVPKDAEHIIVGYSKVEYWQMPDGKRVGPYHRWYDMKRTKKCESFCYNIEGKLHGPVKKWRLGDGSLFYECNYRDGGKHGVCRDWYKDGTLFLEINYREGKYHGVSKRWYEDGTPYYEQNYRDGKRHGVFKRWYKDGTPYYEHNYRDGKKQGVCKGWTTHGKLTYECNYEGGKCVGCVHGRC